MRTRYTRKVRQATSVASKMTDLAFAVPQVVSHRVTRMALAGPNPSARDQKEFALMVHEKQLAFGRAWSAMALQAMTANQALMVSMFRSYWSLWLGSRSSSTALASHLPSAALGVWGKGLEPIRRTAVANAKRLSRTRLR